MTPHPTERRSRVSFNPDHFAQRAAEGDTLSAEDAFRYAYTHNLWSDPESPSGPGASLMQTAAIRGALPALCAQLGVKTLLDLPCGDCHWMADVSLTGVRYVGADVLPEIVDANTSRYASPSRTFVVLDLTRSALPQADLLLVRDCLVHLSFADARRAIENVKRSNIPYLLTTTFTAELSNQDVVTGDWRPLNLQRPPFGFPEPLQLIDEHCTEQDGLFADKSLGLWEVGALPLKAITGTC